MAKDCTLLVMAAGMGSRFGGLKQLEPVGYDGETIAEFSLFDALQAGFSKILFIIKPELEADFREHVLSRLPQDVPVDLCFQRLSDLPEGLSVPEGRTKPWGTAHAVWSARHQVQGPFAVINADDYYGPKAFGLIASHLRAHADDESAYCMAGYHLSNTVTDNGSVSRGICEVDEKGMLTSIEEHLTIVKTPEGIVSQLPEGRAMPLADDTIVSMNAWGFTPRLFPAIERELQTLFQLPAEKLLKAECYLPTVADTQRREGTAKIRVYPTPDKWYGVTYSEDLEPVRAAIRGKMDHGQYPRPLWKKG